MWLGAMGLGVCSHHVLREAYRPTNIQICLLLTLIYEYSGGSYGVNERIHCS